MEILNETIAVLVVTVITGLVSYLFRENAKRKAENEALVERCHKLELELVSMQSEHEGLRELIDERFTSLREFIAQKLRKP